MDIKNYITVAGYATLREELHNLVTKERPHYVHLVNWAASNGDRSESRTRTNRNYRRSR